MSYELRHTGEKANCATTTCSCQSGIVGTAGLHAYTASKHAVIGLTRSTEPEYVLDGIGLEDRFGSFDPTSAETP
jgi:NAD(P)-dependent dehydrogenase (short-subunit alcohol dehydrogenase family)